MGDSDSDTFLYFDGDDVGARIELHLLGEQVDAAAAVSRAVVLAVGNVADQLRSWFDAQIVFAAGDEILAVTARSPSAQEVDALRSRFHDETGLTISCGVGATAEAAARQLRLAKLRGKNRIAGMVSP